MPGVEPHSSPLVPAAAAATPRPGAAAGSQHEPGSDLVCSARGCGGHAAWALRWNNPRLHTPDRRKVWLACDGHLEHLTSFLGSRGFLRETVAVSTVREALPV